MSIKKIAIEAINHLQGSCEALYVHYEAYENNEEFLRILDEHIFNCDQCGWWFDTCEKNNADGNWVCEECCEEQW
jgi:formylmethanofuran dehydrogenase subunit E